VRIYRIRISEVVWFLFIYCKFQNCNMLLNFRLNCVCYIPVFCMIFSPVYLTGILA